MKNCYWLAGILLFVGCGTPGRRLPEEIVLEKEEESEKRGPEQIVTSAGGTVTVYSRDDRADFFTVTWKEAEVDFNIEESTFGGKIQEISGTIVQDGKLQSSFVAREGAVDKGGRKLKLLGGVTVTAAEKNARLVCAEMAYNADTKIIDATKSVEADFEGYLIRGIDHIRVAADLSKGGTPDLFDKS